MKGRKRKGRAGKRRLTGPAAPGRNRQIAVFAGFIALVLAATYVLPRFTGGDAPTALSPQAVFQKPWFIGQVMAGPVTLASNYVANSWTTGKVVGVPMSHARVYEIGVLYTAVAGMLNLMAIIDSSYRASNEGAR